VLEVGRKHTMETGQIQARPGDQSCEPCHKVEGLKHDMDRTIPERPLIALNDASLIID
jgi:hypothetical protein